MRKEAKKKQKRKSNTIDASFFLEKKRFCWEKKRFFGEKEALLFQKRSCFFLILTRPNIPNFFPTRDEKASVFLALGAYATPFSISPIGGSERVMGEENNSKKTSIRMVAG